MNLKMQQWLKSKLKGNNPDCYCATLLEQFQKESGVKLIKKVVKKGKAKKSKFNKKNGKG